MRHALKGKQWQVQQKVDVDAVYEELFVPGNRFGIEYHTAPMKPAFAEAVLEVMLLVCFSRVSPMLRSRYPSMTPSE